MKYLYYVRHGESYINISDVNLDGNSHDDAGLTEKGKEQVRSGAKKANSSGLKPDLIICSPLARTRETADIIAEELGYPKDKIVYNSLFEELRFGNLGGATFGDFMKTHTYADLDMFEDAETIKDLQDRAFEALAYLKSHSDETILVVAHSCFGRALRRAVEGKPYTDEFLPTTVSLPYGEILKYIPIES